MGYVTKPNIGNAPEWTESLHPTYLFQQEAHVDEK